MTTAIEFPLRPYTQDWPGINSTGGKTMRAGGEMSECTNVQINRGDTMEKRKGFVRALDEQFNGVVCGLFVYTDDCGNEFLLVADQLGISIRRPFELRDLQTLDCYPNDGFDAAALDEGFWRNTGRYQTSDSEMSLVSALQETNLAQGIANATRWFKDACSTSYSVRVQFRFDEANESRVLAVIRGSGTLAAGGLILAELRYSPSASTKYTLRLVRRTAALTEIELAKVVFNASEITGFVTVIYDATRRVASAETAITGGNQSIESSEIDAVSDANLGLVSAIAIGQTGLSFPTSTAILQVIGESV